MSGRPVLQVGRLGIPLGDPPTSCGLHGDTIVDDRCPTCDTLAPCPWCKQPTTVDRSLLGGTRGYLVKGTYVGELCRSCAAESREYDSVRVFAFGSAARRAGCADSERDS